MKKKNSSKKKNLTKKKKKLILKKLNMEALFENNETDLSQYAFLKPTENLINIYASYPSFLFFLQSVVIFLKNYLGEYVKSIDENQFHNRMFFYNVEFDELETENIKSFRQYSDIQKADLPE